MLPALNIIRGSVSNGPSPILCCDKVGGETQIIDIADRRQSGHSRRTIEESKRVEWWQQKKAIFLHCAPQQP